MKKWMRLVPILVAVLLIICIFGVQHRNYENQISFDYHQMNIADTDINHDQSRIFHYRSKLINIHTRLQYLKMEEKYQGKKNSAKTKARYKRELRDYHSESAHFKDLKKKQDSNLRESKSNIKREKRKLHRLTVNKY